ncbi:MAG: 50S ribosomal protein L13 [Patescibacteria group bacterium]|jgi:large subunit ribosomal protein L13
MEKKKKITKKPVNPQQTHKIDASDEVLGRLASRIAMLLRGKNKPTFQYHTDCGDVVLVTNAAKLKITGKKLDQKIYYHYSGYPGGMKKRKMNDVMVKNPADVLKRAIWNMLPKNKLRDRMIKRLKISN